MATDPIEDRCVLCEKLFQNCLCSTPKFRREVRTLRQRVAKVERDREGLAEALRKLIGTGETYMKYHTEKFYQVSMKPTGLTPALDTAREALRAHEPAGDSGREEKDNVS